LTGLLWKQWIIIYCVVFLSVNELTGLSWSEAESEKVLSKLELAFRETPRRFFTEHDLHSHLYQLVESELGGRGELFFETHDGQKTSLVHHEYPTPFRCDMSRHGFRRAEEADKTLKGGRYRRGHYGLVILNSEFVRRYDLVTVAGKNYEQLRFAKDKIEVTPLLWACEVIFGAHTGDELPDNWADLVIQDSKKVIETLNYKVGQGVSFLRYGDVIVFLGASPNEKTKKLEENLRRFSSEHQFKIRLAVAT